MKIFVIRHGWVFVGTETDMPGIINDARCIRRWGTTNGLAELAKNGPQPETKLEEPIKLHYNCADLLFTIECNPHIWKCCGCGCHAK